MIGFQTTIKDSISGNSTVATCIKEGSLLMLDKVAPSLVHKVRKSVFKVTIKGGLAAFTSEEISTLTGSSVILTAVAEGAKRGVLDDDMSATGEI